MKTPRVVGELARQLLVGGEDEVGEKAPSVALDPAVPGPRQPPQLGLDADTALVGASHGVGDAERITRAGGVWVCYKRG